jgi:hypothetical protein
MNETCGSVSGLCFAKLRKLGLSPTCTFYTVADPHHFDADLDPSFHFDADPDPTFHFDADPNPTLHFDVAPDPDPVPLPRHIDANLRPAMVLSLYLYSSIISILRPSISSFYASPTPEFRLKSGSGSCV